MDLLIKPYVCAGVIHLGMTSQDILALSLGPVKRFKRAPTQLLPSEHYLDIGVIVSYKSPGVVESIELSRPANPIFKDFNLFQLPIQKIKDLLLHEDPNLMIDSDGFISRKLGIGIYVIGLDDDEFDAEVESIIVFEEGYYD